MSTLCLPTFSHNAAERPAKTWFVSRHQGSKAWIEAQGIAIDEFVHHLEPNNMPQSGDTVIGNLPVHIIAHLNENGIRFLHLSITTKDTNRGKELSHQELEAANISLEEFLVWKVKRELLPST